ELVLLAPDWADIAFDDATLVGLGVYDPDARRRDEDVVDVAFGAGDEPVVQRDHSIPDLACDELCEPCLSGAPFSPRLSNFPRGALFGDGGGLLAVLLSPPLDSSGDPPPPLDRSRGAGTPAGWNRR